jgi:hypothetical protein
VSASAPTRARCERCEIEVELEYDDPRLRRLAKGYLFAWLPFLPVSPIIASDFAVMLPLTMLYLIGVGPALAIVREPGKCNECGAAIEPLR